MSNNQQPAKMWSGRFREPIDRTFERWQRSFPFNWRLLLAGFYVVLLYALPVSAQNYQILNYSIRNLSLKQGERIAGIEIDAQAGAFKTLTNLPVGWTLNIDNDASWRTKLEGSMQVGSAALDVVTLNRMRISLYKNEFMKLKFGLSGTVVVTSDFQHERSIQLTPNNFHQER